MPRDRSIPVREKPDPNPAGPATEFEDVARRGPELVDGGEYLVDVIRGLAVDGVVEAREGVVRGHARVWHDGRGALVGSQGSLVEGVTAPSRVPSMQCVRDVLRDATHWDFDEGATTDE